eukprot:SAG31_NODE_1305_length_8893_cov_7.391176_4_plen_106_part_00
MCQLNRVATEVQDEHHGATPLWIACAEGRLSVAQFLLEELGAHVPVLLMNVLNVLKKNAIMSVSRATQHQEWTQIGKTRIGIILEMKTHLCQSHKKWVKVKSKSF